jgi:hypothetical protein
MAFFNLTDITIKSPKPEVTVGGLNTGSRFGLKEGYESNIFRYPSDLGQQRFGHYMVIHINKQIKSKFFSTLAEDDVPTIFQNQQITNNRSGGSIATQSAAQLLLDLSNSSEVQGAQNWTQSMMDKISSLQIGDSKFSQYTGVTEETVKLLFDSIKNFGAGVRDPSVAFLKQLAKGNFLRTIQRTTDTIALYMPDTLNFTNNQQYSSAEFGGTSLAALGAAAAGYSSIKDSNNKVYDFAKNLTPFILNKVLRDSFQNVGQAVFAAGFGAVTNPQLELIYSSPSFREFRFDFMLYPRSSKEAIEVQNILNRLRFHQAPEILQDGAGALGSFFLVPPSEFDIKFYYNGGINPNIPPISTCVLTSIDTDYAPNGWAAYEVPSDAGDAAIGKTGMPVGIRLSLNFQETEILTKSNYSPNFR